MPKLLTTKERKKRAKLFWELNFSDIEPKNLLDLPNTTLDFRVPPQGSPLINRTCKLPKKWQ